MPKQLQITDLDPNFKENYLSDKICLINKELVHKLLCPNSVKAPGSKSDGVYLIKFKLLYKETGVGVFVYSYLYYTHDYIASLL
jgi:hypothetical protein